MCSARAVSITRSTSFADTSRSLIATMPLELKLRMWLPAMPVNTSAMRQAAINSASSSARRIDCTVASMLTTTPRRRPSERACPRPITWKRPSGKSSATAATTLLVPMSRPTIRSLVSALIALCAVVPCASASRARHISVSPPPPANASLRRTRGKAVAIARIEQYRHRAQLRHDQWIVGGNRLQSLLHAPRRLIAAEFKSRAARTAPELLRPQGPGRAIGNINRGDAQRERRQQGARDVIAARRVEGVLRRAGKVDQRTVAFRLVGVGDKQNARIRQQPAV